MEFVALFFLTVWADFLLIGRVVVSESFRAESLGLRDWGSRPLSWFWFWLYGMAAWFWGV